MIKLKKLNHAEIAVNSDMIEYIEATPDTVISLTNGHRIVVLDSVDEVIGKIIDFRRLVNERPRIIEKEGK